MNLLVYPFPSEYVHHGGIFHFQTHPYYKYTNNEFSKNWTLAQSPYRACFSLEEHSQLQLPLTLLTSALCHVCELRWNSKGPVRSQWFRARTRAVRNSPRPSVRPEGPRFTLGRNAPSSTPAPIQVSPQGWDAEPLTHRMFILFYTKITHALNMVHMILELE